jgi:voltage-gated potassium channel
VIGRRAVERASRAVVRTSTVDGVRRLVLALIVLNSVSVVFGTVDSLAARYGAAFHAVEVVAVAVFTVEFVVRIGSRLRRPADEAGRWRGLLDPYLLIDLLAILPVYVGVASGAGGLGSSSLVRLLRLFKLARYVDGLEVLVVVLRRKRADIAASAFGTALLWLLAASSVYYAESAAQPTAFSSIPQSLWWAGVTITTVGYGDVYPVTPLGRLLGVVVSLLGVGVAAVPSSILVSGFLEETGPEREACPHCGKHPDD